MKRLLVVLGAVCLIVLLLGAMHDLAPASVELHAAVAANLTASGVEHPVTAVLLNFRGYDTLLEIAVLLLALIVILAIGREEASNAEATVDVRLLVSPVLQTLAKLATPLMIMVAFYLLWAGSFRPGGAFQAGAVLAAAAVLLHLAELLPSWQSPGARLRLGLAGGFLIFFAVGAGSLMQGALLEYPLEQAGALILLIESGLTISLGLILAGLFLLLSRDDGETS
jgi:multisubunit Na+/H+ antiporter MnhB subunit